MNKSNILVYCFVPYCRMQITLNKEVKSPYCAENKLVGTFTQCSTAELQNTLSLSIVVKVHSLMQWFQMWGVCHTGAV